MDFSKSKYSEDFIEREIKRVMVSLNIERMPSKAEIELVTQNTMLTNLICKTYGFYGWAKKLLLETKTSATQKGIKKEVECAEFLTDMGMSVALTSVKFPYDILVENVTKIDVKVSNGYTCSKGFWFSFNLEATMPKSDFYVFYCVSDVCNKTIVLPAHIMNGKGQFSVGITSVYDEYIDRWDLVKKHVEFMKSMGNVIERKKR